MNSGVPTKRPAKIFYGWWIVLGTAIAASVHSGLYMSGFGAFFDYLVNEFQCSRAALSGAFSLRGFEGGILGPVEGMLVDKFGPRKIMLVGVFLMGAGFMLLSRVANLTQFYLVFLLMIALGAGLGLSSPAYIAVGNWFVRKQGIAFGLAQSGIGLGGLIVPLLSWLIVQQGWRTAALVSGIAIPFVGIPIALLMRLRPEHYGSVPDGEAAPPVVGQEGGRRVDFTAGEALRTRAFWFLSVTFAIRLMVTGAVTVHFMPFLLDSGFPREVAAAALGSIVLISVAGRLIFGWLGDRIEKRYVTAGLLMLLAGSLVLLGQVKSLWQLVIFLVLYAPAYGGLATLMLAIRGQYFGRKAFGTIMGLSGMVTMLGTVAGPIFAGYTWDITGDYKLAFMVFAAAMALAVGLILWTRQPFKEEAREV